MIIPQSNYDFAQILKAVIDEPSASLRVLISGLTLTIDHSTDSVSVYGTDGTTHRQLKTNPSGELSVNVISAALPSGAATEATLSSVNTIRQKVLSAEDLIETLTWIDFGLKTERVTQIDYSSATYPTVTIRKTFTFIPDGLLYRLTTITWTVL